MGESWEFYGIHGEKYGINCSEFNLKVQTFTMQSYYLDTFLYILLGIVKTSIDFMVAFFTTQFFVLYFQYITN